jgi:hypothetical protein
LGGFAPPKPPPLPLLAANEMGRQKDLSNYLDYTDVDLFVH